MQWSFKNKKQNYKNISIFKSNLTIKQYINDRLKEINPEKKNENEIKKKQNKKLSSKSQNNLHHTNTSSTTISDKSNVNKDISKEINLINYPSFDVDDDYSIREKEKDNELEMIKEENENLKIQLEEFKKKESNLEDILNNFLNESKPISIRNCPKPTPSVQKYPLITVKRKKCKRITKYIRNENEEIYFDKFGNYMKESKNKGNL